MRTPLVSVVVATYRRDVDLKNALNSLAQQTYSSFEIVLVNDNANEKWNQRIAKIVAEFKQNNPDISLQYIINNPNQGSAKTRNIGIEASKGEYVTFLDDDDVYLPEKISSQVEFMQEGDYDYSVTDLELFNENEKLIDKRIRYYIKETTPEALMTYHMKYHITGTDTMMFRKEYLLSIGGFAPIDVGDEFYLIKRAIDGKGRFGYLHSCQIKAYIHTGEEGLSSGDSKIKGENALYEYKKDFFEQLSKKDVRYIKTRHYAVIAYAEIRRKKYFSFLFNIGKSFLISPVALFSIIRK